MKKIHMSSSLITGETKTIVKNLAESAVKTLVGQIKYPDITEKIASAPPIPSDFSNVEEKLVADGTGKTNKQVIILSSKPLSKRAQSVLNDCSKFKVFDYNKYCTMGLVDFLTQNEVDFVYFDISEQDTLEYVANQFSKIPKEQLVLLKRSGEELNEQWIQAIQQQIPYIKIISHIPEERNCEKLKYKLLNNVFITSPPSLTKRFLGKLLSCFL